MSNMKTPENIGRVYRPSSNHIVKFILTDHVCLLPNVNKRDPYSMDHNVEIEDLGSGILKF